MNTDTRALKKQAQK